MPEACIVARRWSLLPAARMGLAAVVFGLGCGEDRPPSIDTYAVTGTVHFRDGKPVSSGTLQFMSAVDQTLTMSSMINADGSFELRTVHENENLSGAIAGPCQVMVMYFVPGSPIPRTVVLPGPYEVKATGPNAFNLKLNVDSP